MAIPPADLPRVLGGVLREVVEVLAAEGAPHMVIGGLAVGAHGRVRATKDVDLSVQADTETTSRIIQRIQALGFSARVHGPTGPGAIVRFVRAGEDGISRWVDLLFSGTPFEDLAIRRASPVRLLGLDVPVASLEDLLVFKMLAGRPQDEADVIALLGQHAGRMDDAYLDQRAGEWDLVEALARFRSRARSTL